MDLFGAKWGRPRFAPMFQYIHNFELIYYHIYRMVRNCIRKTKRQSWTEESMKNAIMVCVNKEMRYRIVASAFDVPQSTLERRV